jgi:uncharacterized protein (DUF2267 family)
MEYAEFVGRVEDRIRPTRPGETENAIVATLDTLGERLSGGEASVVAARLPKELAEHAPAVMAVLGEAIDEGELEDVREQLPQDFYHLLE